MTFRIHCDGASKGNPGPAGIGAFVQDASGKTVGEIAEYIGITTNNVAEYRALLEALRLCEKRGWKPVEIYSDSQLLVRQIEGKYRVKNAGIAPLFAEVKGLLGRLGCRKIFHIPREENREADRLSNVGVAKAALANDERRER